MIDISK